MVTSSDPAEKAVAVTDRSRVVRSPEQIRKECPQFRILVIGKANTGKTTVLRKVCNASPDVKPIVRDGEGNIVEYASEEGHVETGNIELLESRDSEEVEHNEVKPKKSLFKKLGVDRLFKKVKAKPDTKDDVHPKTELAESPSQPGPDVLRPSKLRGNHDVKYEITFPGSNFVFHDSEGFEAGGVDEVQKVKDFIQEKAGMNDLANQLHAIWYCISMDDQRPVSGGEKQFFQTATGRVPVIVVFTKFDALVTECWGELGEARFQSNAFGIADQHARTKFEDKYLPLVMKTDYPPKAHVLLSGMDKEENTCPELSEITASALDNSVLQNLFVSTQMNNLDLCTEYAIREVLRTNGVKKSIKEMVIFYPHFWSTDDYKPLTETSSEKKLKAKEIRLLEKSKLLESEKLFKITKSFEYTLPHVFNFSTFNNVVHKLEVITIVCLVMEHTFWSTKDDWELKTQSSLQVLISQMPLEDLTNELDQEFGHLDLEDMSTAEDQIYKFITGRKLK